MFFRSIAIVIMFISSLFCSETVLASKKYYSNSSASIMSFILLNHSRLIHDIEYGRGDYVDSLIAQKRNSKMDLPTLRLLAKTNQDTYQFAKAVADYN